MPDKWGKVTIHVTPKTVSKINLLRAKLGQLWGRTVSQDEAVQYALDHANVPEDEDMTALLGVAA